MNRLDPAFVPNFLEPPSHQLNSFVGCHRRVLLSNDFGHHTLARDRKEGKKNFTCRDGRIRPSKERSERRSSGEIRASTAGLESSDLKKREYYFAHEEKEAALDTA
jgi:hypothetical protein